MKLYELPENKNIKLYIDDKIVIFGHLDGMYSYCWLEEDKNKMRKREEEILNKLDIRR